MNDKAKEKLKQLQDLIRQKEAIEKKIETLLFPEKSVIIPVDFSLNNEVLIVIKESGSEGVATQKVLRILQHKFPNYGIDRKKVASSLTYLKNNKKQIEGLGSGVYKIISETADQYPF